MMGWIQTYSGKVFEPLSPSVDQIEIEDIAHALSMTCRFNGHCRQFYSVAEHSIWVSRMVPPQDALWGLLHDAAEAYVSDVARPIKPFIAGFEEIETRILEVVTSRFNLEGPVPPSVHEADVRMLATKREQLMTACERDWEELLGHRAYEMTLRCWAPDAAKAAFLERFAVLRVETTA